MFKKRLYTFIIASHSGGKVWRLSLPYSVLVSLGVCAAVGILALGGAALQYGNMLVKVVDYQYRLSENDALRTENHEYKVQTAQLGEKVDILETISTKLMMISGINSEKSLGGVGGVSKDTLNRPSSASTGSLRSIASYKNKASSLELKFKDLNQRITDGLLVAAAAPSIQPVNGYITAGRGWREDPFDPSVKEYHPGVDISAAVGARVMAPADGIVIFAGRHAGYGNIIVIDHKFGITTRYAHLQRMDVKVGQYVSRYDIIGYVGMSGRTTGSHLHYEVWQNNVALNPTSFFQSAIGTRVSRP
jgi:murein DD-endopeptidase MepM/ murein hydrolase activator NlpD